MSFLPQAELPKGWVRTTLGEAFKWGSGGTPRRSNPSFFGGPIPWVIISDLNDGDVWKTATTLTEGGLRNSSARWVEPGSILLAMYGSIGKLGIARIPLATNQAIAFAKTEPILTEYVFWYLYLHRNQLISLGKGGTQKNISQEIIKSFPFLLAPLPEQRRIVAEIEKQFTRIEAATACLRRAQASLNAYRDSVLKAACEGRLVMELASSTERPLESAREFLNRYLKNSSSRKARGTLRLPEPSGSGQNDFHSLRDGWTWTNLAELKEFSLYGPRFSSQSYAKSGKVILRTSDISEGGRVDTTRAPRIEITNSEFHKYRLTRGDLLFTRTGTVGKVTLFNDDIEAIPGAYLIQYRLQVPIETAWYLFYFFQSPRAQRHLTLGAAGVGRPNLNAPTIESIAIPLPPPEEQERIVKEIERRISVLQSVKSTVDNLLFKTDKLWKTTLKSAFEGRLVAQSPLDLPAWTLLEEIRQAREHRRNSRSRQGRGIKPGVSTSGNKPQHPPKPRRDAGNNVHESAYTPLGLPDESGASSFLGLKPQALRPGPFRATPTGGDGVTRERSSPTRKTEERDFLGLSREEQIDHVWESLLGLGAVEKDEAIRHVANDLREKGLARFQRLRQGGALYEAIASAIDRGVRAGSFDRPRRGTVRALLPDAREYSPEEWRRCLLGSLNHHAVEEEDVLRAAADWARENMGLEFSRLREDGVILRGLREALNDAIRRGEVQRKHGQIRVLEA